MKIISEQEVYENLSMQECIELMETALADYTKGTSAQYLRNIIKLPHGNLFGFMPAYLGDGDYFGAKIVTSFPGNAGTGYPSHLGSVLLFDSTYGEVRASVDATAITHIRTGAVSAVATKLLARKDAHSLALIGAGAQARSHMEAISLVRDIKSVTVYDLKKENAKAFAAEVSRTYHIPVTVCEDVKSAVSSADIICTVTLSKEPLLYGDWVKPGTHINAVGSFSATTREVSSDLVVNSSLYCDSLESILKEGGEFLIPKSEGKIDDSHIKGSLGDILLGTVRGRNSDSEITLFDALGLAVEDVACAKAVYLKLK